MSTATATVNTATVATPAPRPSLAEVLPPITEFHTLLIREVCRVVEAGPPSIRIADYASEEAACEAVDRWHQESRGAKAAVATFGRAELCHLYLRLGDIPAAHQVSEWGCPTFQLKFRDEVARALRQMPWDATNADLWEAVLRPDRHNAHGAWPLPFYVKGTQPLREMTPKQELDLGTWLRAGWGAWDLTRLPADSVNLARKAIQIANRTDGWKPEMRFYPLEILRRVGWINPYTVVEAGRTA
jgi:hypothetical protein